MTRRHFVADNAEAIERGLAGYCALHADRLALQTDPRYVLRAVPATDKVALLSGGGSGHEPLHVGFVGTGMLDAAVPGEVFSSPSAAQVRAATLAADHGRGVLHIVKNYTGDVINFRLAAEACRAAGVDVATVVVDDDVPSAVRGSVPGRRGTVATVVVEKICGAAAEAGLGLSELATLGQRVVDRARSVGVALTAGTSYSSDDSAFTLAEGKLEFGVGIHGERGTDRITAEDLPSLVRRCLDLLAADLADTGGIVGPQLLLVNGLGATTSLELSAVYGEVAAQLADRGVELVRAVVDDLVTSLDMRGVSLTLVRLDDELLRWWDAPCDAPAWRPADARPGVAPRPAPAVTPTSTAGQESHRVDPRVARWVEGILGVIAAHADELGELDRRAGDGDFGDNLRTVAQRCRVTAADGNPLHRLAEACSSIGGTSGPMLAVWFSGIARHLGGAVIGASDLADGLQAGTDAVRELGGAAPGDRTMVDAMVPAVDAARRAAGQPEATQYLVLEAARMGAEAAAASTADLVARRGRASYVGEAARGTADPGAVAISLFLAAGADAWS